MALTREDAEVIIDAQERNKVRSPQCSPQKPFHRRGPHELNKLRLPQVVIFVGYMRRYAGAFVRMKEELSSLKKIRYVTVRDIIGHVRPFSLRHPCCRPLMDSLPCRTIFS